MSDTQTKERTKVPILGDLPGMKYVFGSSSKSRRKANLLIFVTPTIVEDQDYQPTETDFLRQPLPLEAPANDVGSFSKAWDGAEPYDWSKPVY
jgi:type II secretory pathway component GspD/PulD (secretin)